MLLDGRGWGERFDSGNWVGPTVLLHASSDDDACKDEIFGMLLRLVLRNWREPAAGAAATLICCSCAARADSPSRAPAVGPVLSVYAAADAAEALRIENSSPYGNAACIYTSIGATAEWFCKVHIT